MFLAILRQQVFHLALVIRVGKFRVAAQGIIFIQPSGIIRVIAVGGAGAGHDQLFHAGRHTGIQHIAGTVHIDIEIPGPVAGILQHGGQVDHLLNVVLTQQAPQIRVTNIHLVKRKPGTVIRANIHPYHMVILAESSSHLATDIAGSAGNQDASSHAPSSRPWPRDHHQASNNPEIRCQTPQNAAIRIMPLACGKNVNRMARPRPEF